MVNDVPARSVKTSRQFRCMQTQQQANAVSAATVDRVGAVVRAIFDHFHAVPRNVSGLFSLALAQQFSYLEDTLAGGVFIGLDAAIGEPGDRIDASLGNLLRSWCVLSIGSLRGGDLLAGQDSEHCHCQDSKSVNCHKLSLSSAIGEGKN